MKKRQAASEIKILSRKKQKIIKLNKHTLQYGAGLLTFVLLIVSALWLPQVFFEVSDALRYGEVSLMEQEKPDVLTLTTGYEESLYRRLESFAEGRAGQQQYYINKQPKEVTEDIREFLFESELRFHAYGIYQDVIVRRFLESLGFSPDTFARKTGMELYQWNQYVIYSDDYAQGVNFILWCFGLKNPSGDNLTILMDAHDYTVYAVQTTGGEERSALNGNTLKINGTEFFELNAATMSITYSDISLLTQVEVGTWMNLNIYYEIFAADELESYFSNIVEIREEWIKNKNQPARIAGVLRDSAGNDVEIYLDADSNVPYGADGEGWYGRGTDGILYYSLPFQEAKMTFDIYGSEDDHDTSKTISITMGIYEIYRSLPEFH